MEILLLLFNLLNLLQPDVVLCCPALDSVKMFIQQQKSFLYCGDGRHTRNHLLHHLLHLLDWPKYLVFFLKLRHGAMHLPSTVEHFAVERDFFNITLF